MAREIGRVAGMRLFLALAGAGGGLSFYLLVDVFDRTVVEPRLHLFLSAFAAVFFGALLALAGPLRVVRAIVSALVLAAPAAGLLLWASARFADPAQLIHAPESMLAGFLLAALPLPYLIAAAGPEGWRHYPTLFSQSWSIVVRYAAAWLFVGVAWVVVTLSDALFGLVGLHVIHDLLEIDAVPFVFSGFILGLALAVINELSDYVSPFLVLRLLRLLLPVVTVVVAVFLLALPLRGLTDLFGQLSVATTLLMMAVAAATLISTALDESNSEAVRHPVMLVSVQALALMLPVLAGLAGWAMWLRVGQYGLTPARIAGVTGSGLVLVYGLLYAVSVLLRGRWMVRIRRGNTVMALAVIALAALWLTPLFNAEEISARNQLARYTSGEVGADRIDLASLQDRLGLAGAAALEQLRALSQTEGHDALRARLEQFDNAPLRPGQPLTAGDAERLRAQLRELLPLRPEDGAGLRDAVLAAAAPEDLRTWLTACRRPLPDGRPGCVLVAGDFLPDHPGSEALLFYRDATGFLRIDAFSPEGDGTAIGRPATTELTRLGTGGEPAAATLARLLDGRFTIGPAALNALRLEERQFLILP
ncbi:DUF4153 domain-containing protein [Acidimangrovimonas pyrenivorans]|uniref:DUF4153 domain-containing protein n=1 Tax=Acidimangrovimonas pyrenivorans TaxID=2030798 RepID=A0ABV7AGQ4_9RHOB